MAVLAEIDLDIAVKECDEIPTTPRSGDKHVSVYNWIKKYVKLMESYLDKMTPQVSDIWKADEIYIKIKGDMKYLFAIMDDETRFWMAQEVADSKYQHNAQNLMKMEKQTTGKTPMTFIIDGLYAYNKLSEKNSVANKPQDHNTSDRSHLMVVDTIQQNGTPEREILVYQVAGQSSSGNLPNWRRMKISKISE